MKQPVWPHRSGFSVKDGPLPPDGVLVNMKRFSQHDFVVWLYESAIPGLDESKTLAVVKPVKIAPLVKQARSWGWDDGDERNPDVDPTYLKDLADSILDGERLPPLVVDGSDLMDGRHRLLAMVQLGIKSWPAIDVAQFKNQLQGVGDCRWCSPRVR